MKSPNEKSQARRSLITLGAISLIILGLMLYLMVRASAPLIIVESTLTTAESTILKKIEATLPQKLAVLGVASPRQVDIHWTAHYVTPVKFSTPENGRTVTLIDRDGNKSRVVLTNAASNQTEVEAVAIGIDKNGNKRFAYRVSKGVWRELSEENAGMGNQVNTWVPMIHVAAEPRKFPAGSMIFLPMAAGIKLGDGQAMDGYFWVSDTGSAVTGNHFDLLVDDDNVYQDFIRRDIKPAYATTIYPLPAPPKGMDPQTDDGLAAILRGQDILKDSSEPPDKKKLVEALLLFQRANPHIPSAEYGDPNAAITLWFLTQAAFKVMADKHSSTPAHS